MHDRDRLPPASAQPDSILRAGVSVIPFGPGLVVVDGGRGRLLAYDAGARRLWDECGGLPSGALAGRWRADGLLAGGASHGPSPSDRYGEATPRTGWADEWTCGIAGLRVRFSEQHPRGAALLRNLFGHLEAPRGPADLHYGIEHPHRYLAVLFRNGREIARSNDYGVVLGALYQSLLGQIHPTTRWRALIHAGVVATEGKAVGLVGPSGSGKSTLLGWLIAQGFAYLADDLMAVTTDGHVAPWPMPLSIKRGSWDILASVHPALATASPYATKGTEARLIVPPATSWLIPPTPLSILTLPTYAPGAAPEVDRLTPFETLVRLLGDRVWIGYPIDEDSVRSFLAWLDAVPAFAIRHGDVRDAERALRDLVAP